MEIKCSYLKELKWSGNQAWGNSGPCPNLGKIKSSSLELWSQCSGINYPCNHIFYWCKTSYCNICGCHFDCHTHYNYSHHCRHVGIQVTSPIYMEINCSYLKELKCSGNHACGNSGHCPNFKKINSSWLKWWSQQLGTNCHWQHIF
jgi:hypothetical protein